MGQSADQIRQEIEEKRNDAAQRIDDLEAHIMETSDQLRDQAQGVVEDAKSAVDDSVQTVKETLDVRRLIEDRPLIALGVALAAGFAIGGMTGGDHDRQGRGRTYQDQQPSTGAGAMPSVESGVSSATANLRDLAHKSGLDETLSSAAAALLGSVTDQFKQTLDRNFPGFSDKMQSAQRTQGGFSEKSQATQHTAASSTSRVYTARDSSA